MTRLRHVLLSSLPLLLLAPIQAQTTTDKYAAPVIEDEMTKDPEQNKMWRTGQARYSAKPRHMWELGLYGGTAFIGGDVDAHFPEGYVAGLHFRRAINYSLSFRLDFSYQTSNGYDSRGFPFLEYEKTYQQNIADFPQLEGYTNEGEYIHRNYKNEMFTMTVEGLLNIGNILFHSPANKWNLYTAFGLGVYIPEVSVDLLNGDQLYDFTGVSEGLDLTTKEGRKESRSNLKELLDGDFETPGGVEQDVEALGDEKKLIPHFQFGVGISRKLSKRLNLTLEHRIILSDNDLLDGFEVQSATSVSTSTDIPHATMLKLGINLGSFEKKVEPLFWVNPLDGPMNDIAELKQRPKFDLTDSDGDGVIDMTDQEVNTPAGCPVDTRGVMLDSDGDGVVDCKDQEPYSPPGYEVDGNGIAKVDSPYLTEDEVVTLINQRGGSAESNLNWFLPMIHFDLDKYYIKPEFYGALHNTAAVMRSHPDLKIVVTGYADNRDDAEYNNVLSYNRAKEAINYLVTNYSLPRDRFILNWGGEEAPVAKGVEDNFNLTRSDEYKHYVNRRVEFRVATSTDKEMSRPEGPEAGENTPGSARSGSKYSGNYNSGY